ncbi:unnamed protein product [Moneuplotes crassus]|uniref:Uncharacterized protein n=1 Tax=Euplotes crassus TaxID=5936 RepID=A0AAD1UI33_EUPCR|nr:unnamed protein product [Moneuplotes crassus]
MIDFGGVDSNRDSAQPSGFSTEGLHQEFVEMGDSEPVKISLKNGYCKFTNEEKIHIMNSLQENSHKGLQKGKRFNKVDAEFMRKNALFFKKFKKNKKKLKVQDSQAFLNILSTSYKGQNLSNFNNYIEDRIVKSQIEKRKFLNAKICDKFIRKSQNNPNKDAFRRSHQERTSIDKSTLGPTTTEDFHQMRPISGAKREIIKENINVIDTSKKSDLWKYKDFKFPSPLPDGCNNVISFSVNKKKKTKELTLDDVYQIFGIRPKDSTESFYNRMKGSQSVIVDESEMLSKRIFRNRRTPIAKPVMDHNLMNDYRSNPKTSHSVVQKRRDTSLKQNGFINQLVPQKEKNEKVPALTSSRKKRKKAATTIMASPCRSKFSATLNSTSSKRGWPNKRNTLGCTNFESIFHKLRKCNIFRGNGITPVEAREMYYRDKRKGREDRKASVQITREDLNLSQNLLQQPRGSTLFIDTLDG